MSDQRDVTRLVAAARARLEWLRDTGVEHVAAGAGPRVIAGAPVVNAGRPDTQTVATGTGGPVTTVGRPAAAVGADLFVRPAVREARTLPALRAAIGDCQSCKLAPHRTHLVFGVGSPSADLVFVGEAPGRDEDQRGEPFVGRAGQLLTEIIVKGMKMRREDVYIANIIKCRPPKNRNPESDEIAACEPFLIRQLALIEPKVIVALGTFAAQVLLKTRTPISRLRGVWADYHGVPLMPTFHPAYLLRNASEKRAVWGDIKRVMAALELPR